ncbi:MAG: hypothetical protein ACE5E4_08800 [Candidatus Binatia bacterium]
MISVRALVATFSLLFVLGGSEATALCGDLSGDGYIRSLDALLTLKTAVASGYDPLGDAHPVNGDGSLSTADALLVLRAAVGIELPPCAAATSRRVVVSTASCNFDVGGIAEIDTLALTVTRHLPAILSPDSVLRVQRGRLFALNRFAANSVQELDVASSLATLKQCSVGQGNPHDIVLVSDTLGYVTRYDSSSLAVIDPSVDGDCEGFVTGSIDLSAWADADGFPEMDQMLLLGQRLFVVLQMLDRNDLFRPAGPSRVVVIDTLTNAVEAVIELATENAFAETKGVVYAPAANRFYVGGPGRLFSDLSDGGIEVVDPLGLRSEGLIVSGADLGGDITDFVMLGTARGYALVAGDDFDVALVEFDVDSASVTAVLARSELLFSDIEITEDGRLWLADRNCFNPGMRVFSVSDNREISTEPIFPGLEPFTEVFLP